MKDKKYMTTDERKSYIIDHLTSEQEQHLMDIHGENYIGTDDDMPDNFEKWLMNLTVFDLDYYLEE